MEICAMKKKNKPTFLEHLKETIQDEKELLNESLRDPDFKHQILYAAILKVLGL